MAWWRSNALLSDDNWYLELAAILGSLSCLVALIVVLGKLDNQPIFDWNGVTLNTIVSILSTTAKAWLMLVLAETISQWKWILFSSRRRFLIDLQALDEASRGPLGSLKLLWHARGGLMVWIGALTTLLAMAFDPFIQQLVQFETRLVYDADPKTKIVRAQRYSKGNEVFSSRPFPSENITVNADFSFQSAVLYGLVEPIKSVVQQTLFTCPSGNCSWDKFKSLAVCSACKNVSQILIKASGWRGVLFDYLEADNAAAIAGPMTEYSLPNGLYIDNLNGFQYGYGGQSNTPENVVIPGVVLMTTFGTGNASLTNTFQDNNLLIWAASMLRIRPNSSNSSAAWPDLPVEATECALYFCVNQYESNVTDGILQETVTSMTNATRSLDSWQWYDDSDITLNPSQATSLEFSNPWSVVSRTDLMLGDSFNMSQNAVDSISSYFQTFLSTNLASLIGNDSINGYMLNDSQLQFTPSAVQPLYASADLNATFYALAASMSNAIRAGSDDGLVVTGMSATSVTFYSIQWPWIILPCVVILAGLIHLVGTVLKGKAAGVGIWKSSPLAILSRGSSVPEEFHNLKAVSAMNERAKREIVQLFPTSVEMMTSDDDGSQTLLRPMPRGI
ncbi:hypothetical protein MMC27_008364 [Xylographa pallens]|nr:hypothetical protein [Xylographa pallens]